MASPADIRRCRGGARAGVTPSSDGRPSIPLRCCPSQHGRKVAVMRSGNGVIFKRCGCRDDGRNRLEQRCPQLAERGHGSWYLHCSSANFVRAPRTRPPRRLPIPGCRPAGPRRVACRYRRRPDRPGLDRRALAAALARHPHASPRHHPPPLHPRRRPGTHPAPRRLPPRRFPRRSAPHRVRPDRRCYQQQRPTTDGVGDAAPPDHPAPRSASPSKKKSQVTRQKRANHPVQPPAPTAHPRDTHRPHRTDDDAVRTAFPQARRQ